jgi:nitroimidazol reductase NimA-like FMN-containing flavoprotein (pyridoxamine 5'-phosphate oxidase superfamily)
LAGSRFMPGETAFIAQERVLRFNSDSGGGYVHCVPAWFAFDRANFYVHARGSDAKRWRDVSRNPTVPLELDVLVFGSAEFLDRGPD